MPLRYFPPLSIQNLLFGYFDANSQQPNEIMMLLLLLPLHAYTEYSLHTSVNKCMAEIMFYTNLNGFYRHCNRSMEKFRSGLLNDSAIIV